METRIFPSLTFPYEGDSTVLTLVAPVSASVRTGSVTNIWWWFGIFALTLFISGSYLNLFVSSFLRLNACGKWLEATLTWVFLTSVSMPGKRASLSHTN